MVSCFVTTRAASDDDEDMDVGIDDSASGTVGTFGRSGSASPRPGNEATAIGSGSGVAATAATPDFFGVATDDVEDGPTGV